MARKVEDLRPDVSRWQVDGSGQFGDAPLADEPAAREEDARTARASARVLQRRADIDVREARPTAAGDRSLIRALGLKIGKIVIDPGHGGHDTGTIGPDGLLEKDLVVDVGTAAGQAARNAPGR